jgi:hypothetical protein
MRPFLKKALPDWLLVIMGSQAVTTLVLLELGFV